MCINNFLTYCSAIDSMNQRMYEVPNAKVSRFPLRNGIKDRGTFNWAENIALTIGKASDTSCLVLQRRLSPLLWFGCHVSQVPDPHFALGGADYQAMSASRHSINLVMQIHLTLFKNLLKHWMGSHQWSQSLPQPSLVLSSFRPHSAYFGCHVGNSKMGACTILCYDGILLAPGRYIHFKLYMPVLNDDNLNAYVMFSWL